MDETLRAVVCPCCRKILCALQFNDKLGRWAFSDDSPVLKKDKDKLYMTCGKCRRRIAFVANPGSVTPFELASVQECRGNTLEH
jgi:hypothetical protein